MCVKMKTLYGGYREKGYMGGLCMELRGGTDIRQGWVFTPSPPLWVCTTMYLFCPMMGGSLLSPLSSPRSSSPTQARWKKTWEILTTSSKNKQPALQDVLKVKLKEEKHNLNPNIDDGKRKICTHSNFSSSILEL